jgi:hypothetical protein
MITWGVAGSVCVRAEWLIWFLCTFLVPSCFASIYRNRPRLALYLCGRRYTGRNERATRLWLYRLDESVPGLLGTASRRWRRQPDGYDHGFVWTWLWHLVKWQLEVFLFRAVDCRNLEWWWKWKLELVNSKLNVVWWVWWEKLIKRRLFGDVYGLVSRVLGELNFT